MPAERDDALVINKKLTTSYLRKICRMESAQVRERQRQEILDARPTDTKLFYKLIKKQRGNVRHCEGYASEAF